jgi:hypothetical protein
LSTDNLSLRDDSLDSSGHILDKIWNKYGKITTYLISNSSPMSRSDKVGLSLTIIAFGIILSPLALSDSDPYHLKWLLDEVIENVPLNDSIGENHDKEYRVIAHLKISQETHLDATEKIILGKYRSFTN